VSESLVEQMLFDGMGGCNLWVGGTGPGGRLRRQPQADANNKQDGRSHVAACLACRAPLC
jgi:hypothetical protein